LVPVENSRWKKRVVIEMDKREVATSINMDAIKLLCGEYRKNNHIDPDLYERFDIKRGLRNQDGTGVLAGLTRICNVHGYLLNEGEKEPIDGELIYRGIDVREIVENCNREQRFGFEETVYLLIFGQLPTRAQLEYFQKLMYELRELPEYFFDDMILKAPSSNIMNKLSRSVLALYSYDDQAEDDRLEVEMRKALQLIARLPNIMVKAYQVKHSHFDGGSMILHPLVYGQSTAESILSLLRPNRKFTKEEALLLDTCMILHAEHGGGNNSTFACRTLTSSGTDAYSAYAAAIGALKGPRHGGANIKVVNMLDCIEQNVKNWEDEQEVAEFLDKIVRKEANDGSGLIYGMGHAVYTKSDPRAVLLKQRASKLAEGTEYEPQFKLLELVEKLAPEVLSQRTHGKKVICANVDLYSGLVYRMLGIPEDLFTPLFACSRMAGWSAHRMEEMLNGKRIIRPAYKAVSKTQSYLPLEDR
jgi:citrate synthase